jgi:activator of Hsp90 ATPase-like protein
MTKPLKEPAGTTTVTKPADREIRIERIFDAPRDRVWRAFTDPALVGQWWGRGNKLVIERLEVKRGGHHARRQEETRLSDAGEGRAPVRGQASPAVLEDLAQRAAEAREDVLTVQCVVRAEIPDVAE